MYLHTYRSGMLRVSTSVLFITLSAHAREGYSSQSVSLSLFHSGEGADFRVETDTSVYILGDDLSPLNVALF